MIAGLDPASMVHGDLLDDGQSEAAAASVGTGAGCVASVEALEHAAEIAFAQTRSMVPDADQPPPPTGEDLHVNAASSRGKAQGVVEQVEDGSMQSALVSQKWSWILRVDGEPHFALICKRANAVPGGLNQVFKIDR